MVARWGSALWALPDETQFKNSDPDLFVILYSLPDVNPASAKTKFASLIYYLVVFKGYESSL